MDLSTGNQTKKWTLRVVSLLAVSFGACLLTFVTLQKPEISNTAINPSNSIASLSIISDPSRTFNPTPSMPFWDRTLNPTTHLTFHPTEEIFTLNPTPSLLQTHHPTHLTEEPTEESAVESVKTLNPTEEVTRYPTVFGKPTSSPTTIEHKTENPTWSPPATCYPTNKVPTAMPTYLTKKTLNPTLLLTCYPTAAKSPTSPPTSSPSKTCNPTWSSPVTLHPTEEEEDEGLAPTLAAPTLKVKKVKIGHNSDSSDAVTSAPTIYVRKVKIEHSSDLSDSGNVDNFESVASDTTTSAPTVSPTGLTVKTLSPTEEVTRYPTAFGNPTASPTKIKHKTANPTWSSPVTCHPTNRAPTATPTYLTIKTENPTLDVTLNPTVQITLNPTIYVSCHPTDTNSPTSIPTHSPSKSCNPTWTSPVSLHPTEEAAAIKVKDSSDLSDTTNVDNFESVSSDGGTVSIEKTLNPTPASLSSRTLAPTPASLSAKTLAPSLHFTLAPSLHLTCHPTHEKSTSIPTQSPTSSTSTLAPTEENARPVPSSSPTFTVKKVKIPHDGTENRVKIHFARGESLSLAPTPSDLKTTNPTPTSVDKTVPTNLDRTSNPTPLGGGHSPVTLNPTSVNIEIQKQYNSEHR